MIPNLFVLSTQGRVLLEKQWSNSARHNICDAFWDEVLKAPSLAEAPLVVTTPNHCLVHVFRRNLFWVSAISKETPLGLILESFHALIDVLLEYFGDISENVIRNNFFVVYQIFDEFVDGGLPMTTEVNQLTQLIHPPSVVKRVVSTIAGTNAIIANQLPPGILSRTPWRSQNAKYVRNEVSFDLIEQLDCVVGRNEMVVYSRICGQLVCISKLSGVAPELALTFNRPSLLSDCQLHRCIRFRRFENEHVLAFIPPDGRTVLMSYRVPDTSQFPIYCKPLFTYAGTTSRVSITIGPKFCEGKTIESVAVSFKVHGSMISHSFSPSVGSVSVDELSKKCNWNIGNLSPNVTAVLEGHIFLSETPSPDQAHTVKLQWLLRGVCLSGLSVDSLDVRNVSYKPDKKARSVTSTGCFEIRC